MTFRTTAAYLSGGVCGPIWLPPGLVCGRPLRHNLRGVWGFYRDGDSFRSALLSLLCREGGGLPGRALYRRRHCDPD